MSTNWLLRDKTWLWQIIGDGCLVLLRVYPVSRYGSVPWQGPSFWTLMFRPLWQAWRSSLHRLLYRFPSVPQTCSILSSQDWTHPQVGRWVLGSITHTWGGVQGRSLHRSEGEVTHSIKLLTWKNIRNTYPYTDLKRKSLTPSNALHERTFEILINWLAYTT